MNIGRPLDNQHICIGSLISLGKNDSGGGILYCKECQRMYRLTDWSVTNNTRLFSMVSPMLCYEYRMYQLDEDTAESMREHYAKEIEEQVSSYVTKW